MKNLSKSETIWLQKHPTLGVSLMDHLYSKLDAMYPIRWRSAHPNEISVNNWRDTWAEAFEEENIMPHQIKKGISECRRLYDWPPSLTEFLQACTTTVPMIHRDFPKGLVHKMTNKERKDGLKKLNLAKEKLFVEH